MKIGFIGLGIMGRPMAKNLLKAGYDVTVDSHSPAAAAELEACGAKVADQPTIGSTCDLVLTMLPNAPQVMQVMLGANGVAAHMQPGSTFIDMTSLNPIASKEIAAELASRGIQMLDAPVSGGEPKAIDGTLSFMVGGEEEVFNAFKPVLLAMGSSAVRCGGIGAGNTTKLANQIIVACNIAACAEAYSLSTMAGVNPEKVFAAIRGGLAGSTLALALRQGAARGTFSNEAGCGSSPITHATAITDHPFKEGMYGSFEVFVDTIIVCTMTSLAIMCSGSDIWASGVKAEALTMSAFDATYGTMIGNLLVTIPLALFAFSTMVGWEINYESAFFYIFPKMETSKIFKVLIRVLWLVPGFIALGNTPDLVWTVVDIASGLWCVPNAIALIALSGVFMKIYHDYNDKYILKTRPISEPLPYIGKD